MTADKKINEDVDVQDVRNYKKIKNQHKHEEEEETYFSELADQIEDLGLDHSLLNKLRKK